MKRKVSLIFVAVLTLLVMTIGTLGITVNAADSSTTEYTITYHLDGGTNAIKNPDVYTSEDAITLQDATKEGYTFEGWYLDAGKTYQITEISGKTGNIELYAKFFPNSYTATFKDNIILTVKVPGFSDKPICGRTFCF